MSKLALIIISISTLLLLFTAKVTAHVLPPVTHWFTLEVTENKLYLHKALYLHPTIGRNYADKIDKDKDSFFSENELEEYKKQSIENIGLWFNNQKIQPSSVKVKAPEFKAYISQEKPLELYFEYDISHVCKTNTKLEIVDYTKYINDPVENAFTAHEYYKYDGKTNNCTSITFASNPDFLANNIQAEITEPKESSILSKITSIFNISTITQNFNTNSLPLLLTVALILGAFHALTPGHGKTLIAAYLVGQHGTIKHAFSLAAITTLTHTSTIFLLGLLSLTALTFLTPYALIPKIELISATAIFIFGILLFNRRLKEYKHAKSHHSQNLEHHHDHTITKITPKSLFTLGISGGINPCPEALAIMLLAISLNQIILGLSLITVFSLGLAGTLVTLGIVAIKFKDTLKKTPQFDKISHVLPVLSACIILLLGVYLLLKSILNTT